MMKVTKFTFNPFQENTYLLHDDTRQCIIIDPGCYTQEEKEQLQRYIQAEDLKPVRLLNTHCHLDHVFGNAFVAEQYGLSLEIHQGELPVLQAVPQVCLMYGLPQPEPSPMPEKFLEPGETINFGNSQLEILYTPGHSPASVSFYAQESNFVIAGDVLFRESIGRTDLPGGDFNTLIASIRKELLPLGDEVNVYSGHGPDTTIGYEKINNPFLNG